MVDIKKRGITGALHGWSEIDTGSGDLPQPIPVFSAEQVWARIQELRQTFDPERFRDLETQILDHLQNLDNPHHDRIASLVSNVVDQILAPCLPGTAPSYGPCYGFVAELVSQLGVTARATEITVVDASGFLRTVGPNLPALDHSTGEPFVCLWPEHTNALDNSDVVTMTSAAAVNGRIYTPPMPGLLSPNRDTQYVVVEDLTSTAVHGYTFAVTAAPGEEWTSSLFVTALNPLLRYLILDCPDDPRIHLTLDLTTGVMTSASAEVIGHAVKLGCGWWRIGAQYVVGATPVTGLRLLGAKTPDTPAYTGLITNMFAVYGPMHSPGPGLAPYIPTSSGPVTRGATQLALDVSGLANRDTGMLALGYVAHKSLTPRRSVLMAFEDISLTCTADEVEVAMREVVHVHPLTSGEPVSVALSYGSTARSSRHSGVGRQDTRGAFAALEPGEAMVFGPFHGGLHNATLYGEADAAKSLEFLIGETLP